ncbi:epidermal growth factor receptor kinase substrate 8-like isoform X3 [Lineus longissimus]|uniref:epidermal growth factor receptor kinase substrate 8-like isoform X3 n=1 Tax=Lineus longissimus TaxID=88925 RepID=UPI00315D2762
MPGAVANGYDWDGRGYSRRTPREDYMNHQKADPPRDYSLDRHIRPTTPTRLWDGPSRPTHLPQSPRSPRLPGPEYGRQDSRTTSHDSYPGERNGDAEGVQYEVDHLATFTVGSKTGLLHPEDGIRKLKLMDSTTGIWTMRCTLILEQRHILVIDKQQSAEIERFPLSLVVDPTAMYNRDRKEVYNNLLLFTVLEDQKKRSTTLTEMHIFQIISSPAQELVDEIKKFRERLKEPLPPSRNHYIPPAPQEHAPQPPENGNVKVQDRVSNFNAMAAQTSDLRRVVARPQKRSSLGRDGDDDSTLSEKTDREVQILNHCFDDIEKFVGRLQMAAESYKELVRRKKNRGKNSKSKGKVVGGNPSKKGDNLKSRQFAQVPDGMLGMRARPPPLEDFVDIFKKFKLAFNLLARLQPYIHDPNAPELIHFLFTPLSLIVDASKDPNIGMLDLVSRIVSPLLTTESKDLLTHCLSSKESEFWMSLGEAWTLSREQWHGYVPPYYPKFSDGWQPYAPGLNDSAVHADISAVVMHQAAQVKRKEETDKARTEAEDHVFQYPRPNDRQYNDTVYKEQQLHRREEPERPYSPTPPANTQPPRDLVGPDPRVAGYQAYVERHIDRNLAVQEDAQRGLLDTDMAWDERQRQFYRELRGRNARIYEVIHERTGRNAKELTVAKGEVLELIDDSRNWWKMRNSVGDMGHAPYTILREYETPRYDDTDGLSPRETSNFDNNKGGRAKYNNWTRELYNREPEPYDHRDNGAMFNTPAPPPPPLPPIAPPVTAPQFEKKSKKESDKPKKPEPVNARSPKDDLHNELLQRMSMGKNRNAHKAPKAPTLYINADSTWEEVEDWLNSKTFSQRVIGAVSGYSGIDIFNVPRNDIYDIAMNREEGHRLESLLTVQKNICGYGTLGSGELKAILRQRKKHAEDLPPRHQNDRDYLGAPPDFVPATPDSLSTASVSSDDSNNPYRGHEG